MKRNVFPLVLLAVLSLALSITGAVTIAERAASAAAEIPTTSPIEAGESEEHPQPATTLQFYPPSRRASYINRVAFIARVQANSLFRPPRS